MLLNPFQIHTPTTRHEAAKLFKELPDARILAGGTFVLNSLKLLKTKGNQGPANILSLAYVTDLKKIQMDGDYLTLGAMVTINQLFESPLLKDNFSILKTVCQNISTNPIRNMATVGGNLTCRYTWTELGAVMIALDAQFHFLDPDGKDHIVLAEDFFANSARSEYLLTHVTIKRDPTVRVAYRRVKKTIHVDVPLLSICLKAKISNGGWSSVRLGINSATAFAQRDIKLESFLNSAKSSPSLAQDALAHLTESIYDTRSNDYKKHMFRVCIKQLIQELIV